MSTRRVNAFSVSADGLGAGPDQAMVPWGRNIFDPVRGPWPDYGWKAVIHFVADLV